jgi:anaerobic sulfite reductase subunit A
MESTTEPVAFFSNRESLYQLLGRLFKYEIDQPLLDYLAGMRFPAQSGDEELSEGYRTIEEFLRRRGADTLTELAADYAKIFRATGISKKEAALPFEAVYTNADARKHVASVYEAKGLANAHPQHIPEDHIALELEFMALLCHESQEFLAEKKIPALTGCIMDQKEFLKLHLLNWVPAFCADVQKCAGTDFYKAVAKIADGFLRVEKTIVDDLSKQPAADMPGRQQKSGQVSL